MEPGDSPAMELTPELRTFFGSRLGAPSLPRRRAAAAAVLRSGDVHRHTPRPVPRHEILHLCWLIVSNMVKSPQKSAEMPHIPNNVRQLSKKSEWDKIRRCWMFEVC